MSTLGAAALGVGLIALIAYTYLGYPLWIALWSRLFPRAVSGHGDYQPSVSVLIAVMNGAEHLPRKLASLRALDYPPELVEILICSDGSTDDTFALAQQAAEESPRIHAFQNPTRMGKPSALNRLRRAASGDVLVLTDVRQLISPNAVRALVSPLADPSVGCVSGNLVIHGSGGPGAYWRYERFIRGAEGRLGLMVGVSGALYALRRVDFPSLPPQVILDDMYVPLSVALSGKSVILADGARAFDRAFDDKREFARKVRTLAGNYQLLLLMPRLLAPTSRTWFSLFSHKLLRLLCPWALLTLQALSLVLALDPASTLSVTALDFWRAMLLGQIAFYTLALLGARAGKTGALARTFVVLNAAAMVGLWRFARGRQAVTW